MWALPALGFNLCPEPAEPNLAPGDREDVGYWETENSVRFQAPRGWREQDSELLTSQNTRYSRIQNPLGWLPEEQEQDSDTRSQSGGEYLHKRGGITCAEPCCSQARFEGQRSWPYIYKTRFDHRGLLLPLPIRGFR